MNKLYLFALIIFLLSDIQNIYGQEKNKSLTAVFFETSDTTLQKIFDEASQKEIKNIKDFGNYKVLVEGGGYNNIWLETQPMGGVMYAKRNLQIAKNNIEIFIDYQRKDGRLPGMISYDGKSITPYYGWLQGFCFPMPALDLYYLLGEDKKYLKKLYASLEKFDNYLWKTRDSDKNGCLETWCIWDTGEDESTRYGESPNSWPFDYPPTKALLKQMKEEELKEYCHINSFDTLQYMPVPIESMNVMSYSYSARDVLSRISKIINNGKVNYWREKAIAVRQEIKSYLWDKNKHACYDRDHANRTMDILSINNLMCMYFGSFDQEMADDFIKYHLLNPQEFWTRVPLPSIAVNNPYFRNDPGNSWSGQPEGLTFQRSIRALENYGHYAELTKIGKKFLGQIGKFNRFPQQFDPFKGIIDNNISDGYGPSILASLEFISRLYGVYIVQNKIFWSCIDKKYNYSYTQQWGDKLFKMTTKGNRVVCSINGKVVFTFTKGARLISDIDGRLINIVGIEVNSKKIEINYLNKKYQLVVNPNSIYELNDYGKFYKLKSVEYCKK
ncbi:MAG: MGH1-like glycoside hydrolase domain-containing protein [Ignavibacteriaceae bacterium]